MTLTLTKRFTAAAGSIRKASTMKPTAAHQRHKDEKLMFGGVLESQKEKKKRERNQKLNGEAFKSIGSDADDSEFYWLSKLSPKLLKANSRIMPSDKIPLSLKEDDYNNESNGSQVMEVTKPIVLLDHFVRKITTVPLFAADSRPNSTTDDNSIYPSVTKILGATMSEASKTALERWKQKMIATLGEEGFITYNKEQLSFGAKFHELVKETLEGTTPQISSNMAGVWESALPVLHNISNVRFSEQNLHHPTLRYKGIVDSVASYRKTPCVIEWKVSEKQKPLLSLTYDAPLQLTAYLGALPYNSSEQIKKGLVVVCYKNGSPAHTFTMDERSCQSYWNLWLKRLQTFWMYNNMTPVVSS